GRVVWQPLMLADDFAGEQPDRAGLHRSGAVVPQETPVVPIGDEAQVLAVVLAGDRQAEAAGEFSHLILRVPTDGEPGVPQLLLRQNAEDVTLILAGVGAAPQLIRPVCRPPDLRIVARGEITRAAGQRLLQQEAKADVPVAVEAGVRRDALAVALDKAVDDAALEHLARVDDLERDAELPRDEVRVEHLVTGAAAVVPAAFGRRAKAARLGPQAQHNALHVVTLLDEECRADRAVHAAAHRDDDLLPDAVAHEDLCREFIPNPSYFGRSFYRILRRDANVAGCDTAL